MYLYKNIYTIKKNKIKNKKRNKWKIIRENKTGKADCMRDKIEISTQLLRTDVAEMSLWWKRGEQEIGMLESVLEEIPKVWSGTAEHLWYRQYRQLLSELQSRWQWLGRFLESVRRCCETYVRCIRQLREVMAGGR